MDMHINMVGPLQPKVSRNSIDGFREVALKGKTGQTD